LSKKSISWRYNTEDMEFIVPTRNLISPSGRPNYDDMLRGYPGLRQQMDARDRKVEALLGDARSCWKTLTQYGGFKETAAMFARAGDPPYSVQSFGPARNARSIRIPEQEARRRERKSDRTFEFSFIFWSDTCTVVPE